MQNHHLSPRPRVYWLSCHWKPCPAGVRPLFLQRFSSFTLSCFHEIVYTELYRTHMKRNLVRFAAVPYIISVVYLCASIAHMWALNGPHLRGSSLLRYCTQYKYALSKQDLKANGLRYNVVTKNNVLVKLFLLLKGCVICACLLLIFYILCDDGNYCRLYY